MSDCPKDDELLAYVRRSLTGALRDAIDQHLSTCSSCPAVVAAAAEELHTSEGGDATAPDDDRSSESSAAQNRRAGEKLGRYVILELLGRGAMGIVYAAYDPQLDRRVALKLMRPDRRRTSLAERFLREGQSMARLSHPNVVAVHDVGVLDDGIFLAMEYVAGRTLQRWLVAETRSWREILAAFIAAGNGLAAAHRAGIVHRDFKPDNVLVGGDGTVRVTDFGLARLGESTDVGSDGDGEARATSITQAGGVLGTPAYMAPEQFRGETATPAADQFAFASALYLALYGQHPFSDAGFDDLRRAVLAGEQREPPRSPVPAHVRRALRRALSTSPTDRFASVEDLLVALRADPARRAGRIAVVALPATIAAGLGVWHVAKPSSSAPEPCRAGSDRLANVWNPSVRSAISTAFTRTGLPYGTRSASRVVEQLDAYVTAWDGQYREACEATHVRGEQSEALLDRRMACLDVRLHDLEAATQSLVTVEASSLEKAADLASSLRPLGPCSDRARLLAAVAPPDDAIVAARVDEVRSRVARVRARTIMGQVGADTLEDARETFRLASSIPYPPVLAEAQLALGTLEGSNGAIEAARASLEAAYLGAERAGSDELAVEASVELMFRGLRDVQYDDGLRWGRLGEAKVARLGEPPLLRADLLNARARLLESKYSVGEARPAAREALRLYETALEPTHPKVLRARRTLAAVEYRASNFEEANRIYAELVRQLEAAFGDAHPQLPLTLHDYAYALKAANRRKEGLDVALRAVALNERDLGKGHPYVGGSLYAVGVIQSDLGMRIEARASYERSIAVTEAASGRMDGNVLPPAAGLCVLQAALGDATASRASCERAIALAHALVGPKSEVAGIIETIYGNALEHLDAMPEACVHYDRAAALTEKAMPTDHVGALYGKARCAASRGDHARAVTLGRTALVLLETSKAPAGDVANAKLELGRALLDHGGAREAATLLAAAAQAFEAVDSDPSVGDETKFLLGQALAVLGTDPVRAERLVSEHRAALEKSVGYMSPALRRRLARSAR